MQKCAEAVAVWLVRCQVIEEQEKELYCYAMESFVMLWSPMILALLLGTITGRVKEGILVIIPFMMIRKFSGGYHAKSLWICLTCSSLLLFLCILISCSLSANTILMLATLAASLNLIIFSPIDHENKVLSIKERKVYQNVTGILTCSLYGVVMIMKYNGLRNEAVCISVGILLTAGLQVPCIVKKFVREWPNSRKKRRLA